MYKIKVRKIGDGESEFELTNELVVFHNDWTPAAIIKPKTLAPDAVDIAAFPDSDILVIDKSRPKLALIRVIATAIGLDTQNKTADELRYEVSENFEKLSTINRQPMFENVGLVVFPTFKKALVLKKNIELYTQCLPISAVIKGFEWHKSNQAIYEINKIIKHNAARVSGACKAIKRLELADESKKRILFALAASCDVDEKVSLPVGEEQQYEIFCKSELSHFYQLYFYSVS